MRKQHVIDAAAKTEKSKNLRASVLARTAGFNLAPGLGGMNVAAETIGELRIVG